MLESDQDIHNLGILLGVVKDDNSEDTHTFELPMLAMHLKQREREEFRKGVLVGIVLAVSFITFGIQLL